MMIAEEYLARRRPFRRLKNRCHGQPIERYAARLVEHGFAQRVTLRSLGVVGDLMNWMASSRFKVADIAKCLIMLLGAKPRSLWR